MEAAHNLKELIMDDSNFYIFDHQFAAMCDLLENADDIAVVLQTFPFHKYSSKVLERVSLRNSKQGSNVTTNAIPQNFLMKFVCHTPTTMRWFRSNYHRKILISYKMNVPKLNLCLKIIYNSTKDVDQIYSKFFQDNAMVLEQFYQGQYRYLIIQTSRH